MSWLLANEWAWFYFVACLGAVFCSVKRGSNEFQIIAAMLLVSWALSNLFVWTQYRVAVFTGQDILAMVVTAVLWFQTSNRYIGWIAGIYGLMILSHVFSATGWIYFAVLNLLYLAQIVLVGVGSYARRKNSPA